jgi:cyanophycinase
MKKRVLELAGGPKSRVVIIPQASNLPAAGPKSAEKWREAGAEDVTLLDLTDPKAAVRTILHADLIWISGGDQGRLMKRLKGTGVPEAIHARYRAGATVGGASAGAAVMSRTMIARGGEEYPRPLANFPIFGEGLGLWPGVIVDHVLRRGGTVALLRVRVQIPAQPLAAGEVGVRVNKLSHWITFRIYAPAFVVSHAAAAEWLRV